MTAGHFQLHKLRLVLLVALLFALLGASIFRTPGILLMAGVLCAAPLLAALVGRLSSLHLRVAREFPTVGTVGETVTGRVTVSNFGRWPIFLLHTALVDKFEAKSRLPSALEMLGEGEHIEPVLAPRAAVNCEEKWQLNRRGTHPIPPLGAGSIDPLGLYSRLDARAPAQTVLVLPRALPLARLGWTGDSWGGSRPPLQAARVAEASDFHGIRAYRPSEGARRIHWKSTARTGVLHIVEWEEEMAPDLTLLLDVEAAVHAGPPGDDSLEAVVTIAASVAAFLLQNGQHCGLMWLENSLVRSAPAQLRRVEGANLAALSAVLTALAHLEPCTAPGANLAQLAFLAAPHLPPHSGTLIVSSERADIGAAWSQLAASPAAQTRGSRQQGQSLVVEAGSWAYVAKTLHSRHQGATQAVTNAPYSNSVGAAARGFPGSISSSISSSPAARRLRRGDSLVELLERGA